MLTSLPPVDPAFQDDTRVAPSSEEELKPEVARAARTAPPTALQLRRRRLCKDNDHIGESARPDRSVRCHNRRPRMEPYGAPWLQSVATARNGKGEVGGSSQKRALQKPPQNKTFGMCSVGREAHEGGYGAVYGAFRSRRLWIGRLRGQRGSTRCRPSARPRTLTAACRRRR